MLVYIHALLSDPNYYHDNLFIHILIHSINQPNISKLYYHLIFDYLLNMYYAMNSNGSDLMVFINFQLYFDILSLEDYLMDRIYNDRNHRKKYCYFYFHIMNL